MITLISFIATLIFGAIWIISATDFYDEVAKWKKYTITISLSVLLFSLSVNIFTKNDYELKTWSVPLENLKDNTFISGHISMILGSGDGEIKQEFEYTMYIKTSDGARLVRLPLKKCRIIYSDNPKLETVMKVYKQPKDWKRFFYIKCSDEVVQYNLKVPRNSIDGVFKLDAQ